MDLEKVKALVLAAKDSTKYPKQVAEREVLFQLMGVEMFSLIELIFEKFMDGDFSLLEDSSESPEKLPFYDSNFIPLDTIRDYVLAPLLDEISKGGKFMLDFHERNVHEVNFASSPSRYRVLLNLDSSMERKKVNYYKVRNGTLFQNSPFFDCASWHLPLTPERKQIIDTYRKSRSERGLVSGCVILSLEVDMDELCAALNKTK